MIRKLMREEFDSVFQLLETSFPEDEYRTYEEQKALLDDPAYEIYVLPDSDGYAIKAFIAVWELDSSAPTFPGCIVPARILGYLSMTDNGKLDYKLISVVDCDPRYDGVDELEHLPAFILKEIANFFENYKTLQNIKVEVGSYHSKDEAIAIVAECREQFRSHMET